MKFFTHYRVTDDTTEVPLFTLTTTKPLKAQDSVLADLTASILPIVTPEHIEQAKAGKFERK